MKRTFILIMAIAGTFFGSEAVKLRMDYPEPALMPQPIESMAPARWGYFNLTADEGKFYLQIGYQFENADPFNRRVGLARVEQGGKIGFIEKTGTFVIPAIYDYAGGFSENNVCVVRLDDYVGVIDVNGNAVIPLKYDGMEELTDGWYEIWEDGEPANLWINLQGKEAHSFSDYLRMREEERQAR